jgi:hypothetical protein
MEKTNRVVKVYLEDGNDLALCVRTQMTETAGHNNVGHWLCMGGDVGHWVRVNLDCRSTLG